MDNSTEKYLTNLDKENFYYHWANESNIPKLIKAGYEHCAVDGENVSRGKFTSTPQVLMRLPIDLRERDEEEKSIFNHVWNKVCMDMGYSTMLPKIVNHGVDLIQFEEYEFTKESSRQSVMRQEYGDGIKLVLEIALNRKVADFLFRNYLLDILLSADLIDEYIINSYCLYETALRKYLYASSSKGLFQLEEFDLSPLLEHEVTGSILKGLIHAKGVING
jgi:hypothetical protein